MYNNCVKEYAGKLKGKYNLITIPQGEENYEKFIDKTIDDIQKLIKGYIDYI